MNKTTFFFLLLCQPILHAAAEKEEAASLTPFETLMHYIETDDKKGLIKMISEHPKLINQENDYNGKFFITNEKTLNCHSISNLTVTPLVYAILQGKTSIVQLLIANGANKHQKVNGYLPIESIQDLMASSNSEKIKKMNEIGELFITSTEREKRYFPAWEKYVLQLQAKRAWDKQKELDALKENIQPITPSGTKRKRNLVRTISYHNGFPGLPSIEPESKKRNTTSKSEVPQDLINLFKIAGAQASIYQRKKS